MNVKAYKTGILVAMAFVVSGLCASGVYAAPATGQTGHKLSHQDEMWLGMMHQTNLAEIKQGRMAQKKGYSSAVRLAGRAVASNHAKLDAKIMSLAHQLNIALSHHVNSDQEFTLKKLHKKTGADFDRSWLGVEMGSHHKAIEKTRYEVSHGLSKRVEGLAKGLLPILEKHLRMLGQISKKAAGGAHSGG
ncbi:MAG: DUF4142 domain-containing protein [Gammaproteobacteria bacterium]